MWIRVIVIFGYDMRYISINFSTTKNCTSPFPLLDLKSEYRFVAQNCARFVFPSLLHLLIFFFQINHRNIRLKAYLIIFNHIPPKSTETIRFVFASLFPFAQSISIFVVMVLDSLTITLVRILQAWMRVIYTWIQVQPQPTK